MVVFPRLLTCLLPFLMAAVLSVAGASAKDGQAEAYAVKIGNNALPASAQLPVDHSSRLPRHRASLEEYFDLDDDIEQFFKRHATQPPELFAGYALQPCSLAYCYRAYPPHQRPCAAYPTGPPHA